MSYPNFFQRGPVFHTDPAQSQEDNQRLADRLAQLVGMVAFGLPVILYLGAIIGGSCLRDSISHFYHAQFLSGIFVGLLFFIGAFLIAYSGRIWIETGGSTVAGLGAIAVAVFPTAGSGCETPASFKSRVFVKVTNPTATGDAPTIAEITEASPSTGANFFQLFGAASEYHMAAAGLLFVYLGCYCMFVMRRIVPEIHGEGETLLPTKRARNVLYFWCAVTIWFCVALLALRGWIGIDDVAWNSRNLTFYVEMIALWAFGLAWGNKGRARVFLRFADPVLQPDPGVGT